MVEEDSEVLIKKCPSCEFSGVKDLRTFLKLLLQEPSPELILCYFGF